MPLSIERYALLGDTESAALVGDDGAVEWLCWPRFDSDACFAALLGESRHGYFRIAPCAAPLRVSRRYREETLVLETDFECQGGSARVVDCMPVRSGAPDLVRLVEGLSGTTRLRLELAPRFGYGNRKPWTRRHSGRMSFTSAPDALSFWSEVPLVSGEDVVSAEFDVRAGQRLAFRLAWHSAYQPPPEPIDARRAVAETERWWKAWCGRCRYHGPWREAVVRSLITLKALTFAPTGGIVAAPTTSLPEQLGGVRNWDYRFCWLRDATLTLYALLEAGYVDEAWRWTDWLVRVARGEPERLQIMYGVGGERRLQELELPFLPGYEGSLPVRIGNAAASQFQLDIYGEVIDCIHHARTHGLPPDADTWDLQRLMTQHLETVWRSPDEGLWEVRAARQHFTHSKLMTWVAFDRMVRDAQRFRLDAPVERWRALRDEVHREICSRAFDPQRGAFMQSYGSKALDASALLIPTLGFLPSSDARVRGTIRAIQRDLCRGGLVYRYDSAITEDGLPAGEGAFIACSFWLADALYLIGEEEEALALFQRLLSLRNDVGLLAEEFDPKLDRLLGNFPQAFSHIGLVNTAVTLSGEPGPATRRPKE